MKASVEQLQVFNELIVELKISEGRVKERLDSNRYKSLEDVNQSDMNKWIQGLLTKKAEIIGKVADAYNLKQEI